MSHFDKDGNARMVDVSDKEKTLRIATATGIIKASDEVLTAILQKTVKKGDVLTVAQVAGIMATKQTQHLIPMCHNISLTNATVTFEPHENEGMIRVFCTVKTEDKTGVEMEALTGVSMALLTIYDMCKSMDKRMEISDIHLVKKSGGKSGDFTF